MPVLFWRHVIRSSDAGTSKIYLLIQHFGNPEISKFDLVIGYEYVGGFQIAMKDTFVVHVKNGEGDLSSPVNDLTLG